MSPAMRNDSPAPPRWRAALLALALLLAATNLVELAVSLRGEGWEHVGLTGLRGSIEHGKLRVEEIDPQVPAALASVRIGDLVTWEAPVFGPAPSALNFVRPIDRTMPVLLVVEHDELTRRVSTLAMVPVSTSIFLDYALQISTDLVYALVGALMIFRRSGDKAVRALGIAMICWSSSTPSFSSSPAFDGLFLINQLTARVWYQVLLVYWAIHLAPSSRWGVSRSLVRVWPVWALASIGLGFYLRYSNFFPGGGNVVLLQKIFDGNHLLMYAMTVASLVEGVFSTRGEVRTRIKWGLFIFAGSFILFPFRILGWDRAIGTFSPELSAVADYSLQLILPLGLLYATLRHRLLDVSFAINRGLVYGAVSSILLMCFFGLEKLSEHFIHFQSHQQNAMLDGAIALAVFLFFHKVRHWVEHAVEKVFFSAWRKKENALRLCVAKSVHITHVGPLLAGFIDAVDHLSDHAGCAVYRAGEQGGFQRIEGSLAGAPVLVDADDPLVVAMRFERRPVFGRDIAGAAANVVAFPMIYRGRVDGFLLLHSDPAREAYRPDEIDLLAHAVQQIGLDLAALQADENRRRSREWEQHAQLMRASAQETRAMLEMVLAKATAGGGVLQGGAPDQAQAELK